MWDRYRSWASSAQGTWVIGMGFFFVALLNVVSGNWLLTGVMAAAGAVTVVRAWQRGQRDKARG